MAALEEGAAALERSCDIALIQYRSGLVNHNRLATLPSELATNQDDLSPNRSCALVDQHQPSAGRRLANPPPAAAGAAPAHVKLGIAAAVDRAGRVGMRRQPGVAEDS